MSLRTIINNGNNRKKFGNRVYLYEAICKRVNGKPRIVSQRYLGKPEDVGEYLLLATINRAVAPKSKRRLWEWYQHTTLWRLLGYKRRNLTSQRFLG